MPTPLLLAALLAALLVPAHATAAPVLGVEAFGGWNRYSMREMNDSLQSFDRAAGTRFASFHSSIGYGFAARAWAQDRLLLRLAYEELPAETHGSGLTFEAHARAVLLSATWFTAPERPLRFGLGVGGGPYFAHGSFHGDDVDMKVGGIGFGGFVAGEAALAVGGGAMLHTAAGWRIARIDPIELEGRSMGAAADDSGPWLRLGVAYDAGSF